MIQAPSLEADDMSKTLTKTTINEILSKGEWQPSGKLRIVATHGSTPLLKKAGVPEPRVLEKYDVSVRRGEDGLLALNPFTGKTPLPEVSDDDLYEKGGIFSGETPGSPETSQPGVLDAEAEATLALLEEMFITRTFEIPVHSHQKIRVQILAMEDQALPAPCERGKWKLRKATNLEIYAAISALHLCRNLSDLELV